MNDTLFKQFRDAYHGIFGVPDYEAYLGHMETRHPNAPRLTRREFAEQWIERRYSGMRSRCC